jgi:hypothetical protein
MLAVLKALQSNKHWLEVMTDLREEVMDADIDMKIELLISHWVQHWLA